MSIATRLQREIKSNPAKSAGLGVLLLVAAWFWAPLLSGMIGKGQPTALPPPAATPPVADSATSGQIVSAAQPQTAPAAAIQYDWQQYAQQLDEDPTAQSAADWANQRDPFAGTANAAPPVPDQPAEPPKVVAAPMSPAEAGLILSTTLLGSRKRIAEINGASYSVGDLVDASNGESVASFRVVDIQPRRVLLESQNQIYELTIPRPLVDSAVEIRTGQVHSGSTNAGAPSASDDALRKPGNRNVDNNSAKDPAN